MQDCRLFFNEIAYRWDEKGTKTVTDRLQNIFDTYLSEISGKVLDTGCGTGILIPILEKYKQISRIIELDIAENMVRNAKNKKNFLKYIDFINGDAVHIPLTDNSIDTIIAYAIYPHIHDPQKALEEFYRILKPGGRLVILHLMGHKELNDMHREAHQVVARHYLPPAEIITESLKSSGFKTEFAKEQTDLYLIKAVKSLNN
jgi:ubiquinone/menaquinone biosynthesis C-methylase UbiE